MDFDPRRGGSIFYYYSYLLFTITVNGLGTAPTVNVSSRIDGANAGGVPTVNGSSRIDGANAGGVPTVNGSSRELLDLVG